MDFLNYILTYDKKLLLFLHSKGNTTWDGFWIFITNPVHWIPLFFIIFFLGYTVFGAKKAALITLITSLAAITSLMVVNLIKNSIQRLRPINDVAVNEPIRKLLEISDFSFVSGHSTVSFTITFISFWIFKKRYRFAFLLFLFPFLFAYSRIYLAVHYPIDILGGLLVGYVVALIFYKIIRQFILK